MDDKEKLQQAAINVYGIANIGCTIENPTFQTLVQDKEAPMAEKCSKAEAVNTNGSAKKAYAMDDILASDYAMKYWQRLQEQQFVDQDCQLLPNTTRKQAMYIAEAFAEKLRLSAKWKPFQDLWGISNLAQEKWDCQQTGTLPSRYKEIDRIFAD